jgi:hypothetical protein
MGKLLSFLFGKSPDIFDADGRVVHKLPDARWKAWRERFDKNADYDWHRHQGTKREVKIPAPKKI